MQRTEEHYRAMFAGGASVNVTLAAAALYAARHGIWSSDDQTGELAALARILRARYGDTLDAADMLREMDAASDVSTTTFLLKMSARERIDMDVLAGDQSAAEYIRGLIAADAAARGMLWHADIQGRGQRGAGRRKKRD